jgi:hypothetical protein
MPESGTFGSVRGVPGNAHSYRDNGATARLLGHRQTKGAATDKPDLSPPRHTPTLPISYRREELKRSFVVLSISEDLLGWDGSQRWL